MSTLLKALNFFDNKSVDLTATTANIRKLMNLDIEPEQLRDFSITQMNQNAMNCFLHDFSVETLAVTNWFQAFLLGAKYQELLTKERDEKISG